MLLSPGEDIPHDPMDTLLFFKTLHHSFHGFVLLVNMYDTFKIV